MIKLPRDAVSPLPAAIDPNLIAYNAWLRRHVVLEDTDECEVADPDYLEISVRIAPTASTPRSLLPRWQTTIPSMQRGLVARVIAATRRAEIAPDLYIWRLTRDTGEDLQLQDLPEMWKKCRELTAARRYEPREALHFSRLHGTLRQIAMYQKRPIGEPGNDEYLKALVSDEASEKLDLVFRWAVARASKVERLIKELEPRAAIQFWMSRDVYQLCDWTDRLAGAELLPIARSNYMQGAK